MDINKIFVTRGMFSSFLLLLVVLCFCKLPIYNLIILFNDTASHNMTKEYLSVFEKKIGTIGQVIPMHIDPDCSTGASMCIENNFKWKLRPEICNKNPVNWTCTSDGKAIDALLNVNISKMCNFLEFSRIRSILFCGDSFVRQGYTGMILLLTNNYKNGALRDRLNSICEYNFQFYKNCRNFIIRSKHVCQNVKLQLKESTWCKISENDILENDIIIWGSGNHPIDIKKNIYGQNNAKLVDRYILQKICTENLKKNAEKVFYLSPHRKKDDKSLWFQTLNISFQYVKEMPYYLNKTCNISNIMYEPWDITSNLVHIPTSREMTFDGVHWSLSINILKAYFIIENIENALKSRALINTHPHGHQLNKNYITKMKL